jgi:hypothetical protein
MKRQLSRDSPQLGRAVIDGTEWDTQVFRVAKVSTPDYRNILGHSQTCLQNGFDRSNRGEVVVTKDRIRAGSKLEQLLHDLKSDLISGLFQAVANEHIFRGTG